MQNKMTEHSYITILNDSLDKKIKILDEIADACKEQELLLKQEKLDMESFDLIMDKKDEYISELDRIDNGFQSVYDRVKAELNVNKEKYKDVIVKMQEKIRIITDKSMDIQAMEARNKEVFTTKVVSSRKSFKTAKNANKVAASYYQSMSKTKVIDSQFFDAKK